MAEQESATNRILRAVREGSNCTIEELLTTCTDLPWEDVFLEVDRLIRSGQLRMISRRAGSYTVKLGFVEHR